MYWYQHTRNWSTRNFPLMFSEDKLNNISLVSFIIFYRRIRSFTTINQFLTECQHFLDFNLFTKWHPFSCYFYHSWNSLVLMIRFRYVPFTYLRILRLSHIEDWSVTPYVYTLILKWMKFGTEISIRILKNLHKCVLVSKHAGYHWIFITKRWSAFIKWMFCPKKDNTRNHLWYQ